MAEQTTKPATRTRTHKIRSTGAKPQAQEAPSAPQAEAQDAPAQADQHPDPAVESDNDEVEAASVAIAAMRAQRGKVKRPVPGKVAVTRSIKYTNGRGDLCHAAPPAVLDEREIHPDDLVALLNKDALTVHME